MERLLPECRPMVIALRVIVVLGFAGCSNQQMSASNPFMSPDRVPPPATRTIAPGTAAPYYPGDPMPAAQNAIPGQPTVAQIAPAAVPAVPAPTAPAQFVSPPAAQVTAGPPATTPPATQPLAFSNERNVAIPTDSQDLRFAVPAAVEPQQMMAAAPQTVAAPQVIPAGFNQPIASQPAPAASLVPSPTADDATDGPWRSPQIGGSASPVMQAQYAQPQTIQQQLQPQQIQPTVLAAQQPAPVVPTSPQMPVELRAVPSPTGAPMMAPSQGGPLVAPMATTTIPATMIPAATVPATTPPPRMRFPSITSPSTWFTPQPEVPANQQLVGYMVPGPNGTSQMISVEQYQAMAAGAVQPATTNMGGASVATSDGFRPRGSATK